MRARESERKREWEQVPWDAAVPPGLFGEHIVLHEAVLGKLLHYPALLWLSICLLCPQRACPLTVSIPPSQLMTSSSACFRWQSATFPPCHPSAGPVMLPLRICITDESFAFIYVNATSGLGIVEAAEDKCPKVGLYHFSVVPQSGGNFSPILVLITKDKWKVVWECWGWGWA